MRLHLRPQMQNQQPLATQCAICNDLLKSSYLQSSNFRLHFVADAVWRQLHGLPQQLSQPPCTTNQSHTSHQSCVRFPFTTPLCAAPLRHDSLSTSDALRRFTAILCFGYRKSTTAQPALHKIHTHFVSPQTPTIPLPIRIEHPPNPWFKLLFRTPNPCPNITHQCTHSDLPQELCSITFSSTPFEHRDRHPTPT